MTRKGFALIEATVTLFVLAIVGIALLDLLVMARRMHSRRQVSAYTQGLLNSALSQTMSAPIFQSEGTGSDGYSWKGTCTQMKGYRRAVVTLTGPGSLKLSGELLRIE